MCQIIDIFYLISPFPIYSSRRVRPFFIYRCLLLISDLTGRTVGLAVFIVFGTQRDIWRVWRTVTRHLGSENSSQAHHGQSTFADGPESEQDTRQSYRLSHIRPDSASRRLSARVSWALNRLSLGASRSSSRNRSGRSPIPLAISRPEGVKKHTVSLPIPAPVGNGRRGHRRSRSDLAFGYTLGNGHPFPLVIPPLSSFSHSHNHHLQQSPKKEVGLSELGFLKSAWSSRKQQVEDDGGKDLGYEVDIESELGSDDLEGWRLGENLELTPGGIAPLHQDASARPRTTSSLPRLVLPSGGGTDPGHATDMPIQELSPTYSSSSTDQYSPLQFSSTSQDAMISFSLETPITSPTRIPLLSSILTSPPQHPSSTLLNTLENSETMTTITTSSPPSSDPFRLSNSLHMSPHHHPHPLVHISSPPPPPPALSWSPSDSFSPTNDVLDTPVLPMIFLPLPSGGGGGRPASAGAGEGGGGRRVSQVSFASAGSGRRGEGDYWHAI